MAGRGAKMEEAKKKKSQDPRMREAMSKKNQLLDATSKIDRDNGSIIRKCEKGNLIEAKKRIDDPEMDVKRPELGEIKFEAYKGDVLQDFDPDTMAKEKPPKKLGQVDAEDTNV